MTLIIPSVSGFYAVTLRAFDDGLCADIEFFGDLFEVEHIGIHGYYFFGIDFPGSLAFCNINSVIL